MSQRKKTNPTTVSEEMHIVQDLTSHIENTMHIQVLGRSINCRIVTESEIDSYAQYGLLSTIFLTLFGLFTGFALSCIVVLIQGNISNSAQITFQWLAGAAFFIGIIFLIMAVFLFSIQKKRRQMWE